VHDGDRQDVRLLLLSQEVDPQGERQHGNRQQALEMMQQQQQQQQQEADTTRDRPPCFNRQPHQLLQEQHQSLRKGIVQWQCHTAEQTVELICLFGRTQAVMRHSVQDRHATHSVLLFHIVRNHNVHVCVCT
jgi:hypothetical protein